MRLRTMLTLVLLIIAFSGFSQVAAIDEHPDPQDVPNEVDPDVDPDGLEGIMAGPASPTPAVEKALFVRDPAVVRLFAYMARIAGF